MIVAAVAGSKKSGKTETAEALVRGLTKQGCRVAMAKHVQGKEFTVDARAAKNLQEAFDESNRKALNYPTASTAENYPRNESSLPATASANFA